MSLSIEASNLINNQIGYREDNIGTSRSYKAIDVLEFEYKELGNTDILYTITNNNLFPTLNLPETFSEQEADIIYLKIKEHLIGYYKDYYAFWLCDSIENLIDNYIEYRLEEASSFEIVKYSVPTDALILSDLGEQGILLMVPKPQRNYRLGFKELTRREVKKMLKNK